VANPAQDDSQQRAELRIAFLKHLPKRLDQVCRRGRRFCQDGWDINGLSLLHDDVQRMAGVAGRYGALEASQQLLALETLLGRYLADESLPDAAGNAALLAVFEKLTLHAPRSRPRTTGDAGSPTSPRRCRRPGWNPPPRRWRRRRPP
jgi:hypothetical protein